MEKDYREGICEEINEVVNLGLGYMTPSCKDYYLINWDRYCDELDIDRDTTEKMYLWIVSRFDPDYHIHNI